MYIAATLICVRLFAYQGVLMGQTAADVVSAAIALLGCNPMKAEASMNA